MFPGAESTELTKQCLFLYEAYILMGKIDNKQVNMYYVRRKTAIKKKELDEMEP